MKPIKIIPLVLVGFLGTSSPGSAQIPVTDAINIGREITEWVVETYNWYEKLKSLQENLDEWEKNYDTITGDRGLGEIFNNPEYSQYLPEDWQTVYNALSNGSGGLTESGNAVFDLTHVYNHCTNLELEALVAACNSELRRGAQTKAFIQEAYETATSRMQQIDSLMKKIKSAQDPKAIAELQARIAAEQAQIENEKIKTELFGLMINTQEELTQQRLSEINTKQFSSTGGVNLAPLTFTNAN